MRVVVFGATGNHGSSLVRLLSGDPAVDEVVGVARRMPSLTLPKVAWRTADISRPDASLDEIVEGADVVVHLAWLIQPSRREDVTAATNVEGSRRVFEASARAGAAIVYASSVGAYSPGPKDRRVDETWPTGGVETSYYSRHKAATERQLDAIEAAHPGLRVVRIRPGLVFKREAATQIRRLFIGPFLPSRLAQRRFIPIVPEVDRLRFQAVHTEDLVQAYRLATVRSDARGAFNIAAEPVLDPKTLSEALGARRVRVHPGLLRAAAAAAYRLRLTPTSPDWLDMGLGVPLMDTTRARQVLGWEPRRTAVEALHELLEGIHDQAGLSDVPPLAPETGGPARVREVLTGVGETSK